ncbi:DUF883 family protein [Noviherbaspirillum suwonense]|jgi:ElaB/YqjD/DUF883 family membrane-anchored ribosome-binding protein|uniref:Membrane-anchored ribosome-binding protein, inhibits growth in stationary phase, ElaB/YqjD/DUF883 family n=1 Tax=Noviherbaspirillum suwonense TaxID=1224511 RepID=A0ABY1QI92_9BURK|nr:DUF883 domain-containing protein [Noviherbaspirillum suwonense]SMP71630.1 Membrane-anchored ribosome-binding protein, inhibits growth in stationary phase, ElaB/YqjD/DUF883 family [Noviherbaspirillum suwonense]
MSTSYPGDLSSAIEMEAEDMKNAGTGDLRSDLADLKKDLDALLGKASTLTDRELRDARDRLFAKFGSVKEAAQEQFQQGVGIASDYAKEKPMQAVAIAAGVGLLLGALTRR